MPFEHLFSPLTIRSFALKNRILVTSHTTGFLDEDDLPDDRCVAYYRERAKGGAAMLALGTTAVHPNSPRPHQVYCGFNEAIVPRYRALADAVHEFGSAMLVQLGHMGQRDDGKGDPMVSASEVAVQAGHSPRALTGDEVEDVIEAFAHCARLAEQGGLDGVELAFGHGQLVNLFLSPLTNPREDEWGGSLERRMKFAERVMERVRARTAPGFIVGARINFDDMVPGSLGELEWLEIAGRLAASGHLDFLNVSTDFYGSIVPPMTLPHAAYAEKAGAIKRVAGIPTFAAIRVVRPDEADAIIAAGHADMVGMTRAHIADPWLGTKAREGRIAEIRPCVGCLQMCIGEIWHDRSISCVYNPVTGREQGWAELPPAATRKRIVVVGGGPAGLEAARVAASRGHAVTLFERRARLGGLIPYFATAPSRDEFALASEWLASEVQRLGVDVRLGVEVSATDIIAMHPDAVVVATGSAGATPRWYLPGASLPLASTIDILTGRTAVPPRATVIDDDNTMEGITTADYMAAGGAEVEIVTAGLAVGWRLDPANLAAVSRSAIAHGVRFRPYHAVERVEGGALVLTNVYTSQEMRIEAPGLVVTTQRFGDDRLWRELRDRVPRLHAAGDCMTPRRVEHAVLEAHTIARAL